MSLEAPPANSVTSAEMLLAGAAVETIVMCS
jgi:hypothetical protein